MAIDLPGFGRSRRRDELLFPRAVGEFIIRAADTFGLDHPHIAGPSEIGWRIINVVPSREQFEAFAREQLFPAVQKAENVTPQLTFFPVYRLIRRTEPGQGHRRDRGRRPAPRGRRRPQSLTGATRHK
jgi:hypothetical protein